MNINHDVAIFWNIGKASPSNDTTGYAVVEKIRTIAHTLGTIKSFRVYCDDSQISPSMKHLRTEFHQCGVSILECPASGCDGDYADKVMSGISFLFHSSGKLLLSFFKVDIILYATDHPANTIIIISNDPDFAYLISTLRLRNHLVVIAAPSDAHLGLKVQASHFIDCDSVGLLFKQPIINRTEPVSQREHWYTMGTVRTSTANDADIPIHQNEVSAAAAGVGGHIISDIETMFQYDANSQPVVGTSTRYPAPQLLTSLFNRETSTFDLKHTLTPRVSTAQPTGTRINKDKDRLFPFSEPGDITPISTVKGVSPDLHLPNPFSGSLNQPGLLPVLHPPFDNVLQKCDISLGEHESSSHSISKGSETSTSSFSVVSSVPFSSTAFSTDPFESKKVPVVESQPPQTDPPFTLEANAPNSGLVSNHCRVVKLSGPPALGSHSPKTAPSSLPLTNSGILSNTQALKEQEDAKQHASTSASRDPPSSSSLPNVVPTPYIPLVHILKQHLHRGKVQAERSIVATELKKLDSGVYQKANTTHFKQYSIQAEKAGLVQLGHDDLGIAWIALCPKWHDSVSLAPA
ncbi:hypothetical protein BDQ17DRAFT_1322933 [Cyathus striatus]|nr:hypothetical protein BDQ17DRAFT_1322933 [Cyathus striatus]